MIVKMRKYLALVVYCLLFSVLFVLFYTYIDEDRSSKFMRRDDSSERKSSKTSPSKSKVRPPDFSPEESGVIRR